MKFEAVKSKGQGEIVGQRVPNPLSSMHTRSYLEGLKDSADSTDEKCVDSSKTPTKPIIVENSVKVSLKIPALVLGVAKAGFKNRMITMRYTDCGSYIQFITADEIYDEVGLGIKETMAYYAKICDGENVKIGKHYRIWLSHMRPEPYVDWTGAKAETEDPDDIAKLALLEPVMINTADEINVLKTIATGIAEYGIYERIAKPLLEFIELKFNSPEASPTVLNEAGTEYFDYGQDVNNATMGTAEEKPNESDGIEESFYIFDAAKKEATLKVEPKRETTVKTEPGSASNRPPSKWLLA
jgi:hypothetical protein